MSLSPVTYWRLGELSGAILEDSGPLQNHGEYRDVDLGYGGAITGDPDQSVFFGGFDGSFGEVPDHSAHSLTQAWDRFHCFTFPELCRDWGRSAEESREPNAPNWERQLSPSDDPYDDPYFGVELPGSGSSFYPAAFIDATNVKYTFQQGLPVELADGDMQIRVMWSQAARGGPLQPVALIARRQDENNYIRAELTERTDHQIELRIIRTVDGTDYVLALNDQIGTYSGGWWLLRFQFDGVMLRARAWEYGTPQPTAWTAVAEYADPTSGTIAVRASNEESEAEPIFYFKDFWTQTLGLTISLFVKLEPEQETLSDNGYVNFWGKASRFDSFDLDSNDGNSEYEFRYTPAQNGEPATLKGYIFPLPGGLGAGQNVNNVLPGVRAFG